MVKHHTQLTKYEFRQMVCLQTHMVTYHTQLAKVRVNGSLDLAPELPF